jgi:glycosyltransferase involved in cell wall biosynthesis
MKSPFKNIWFVSQYAGAPGIGMQYRQFLFCTELQKRGHRASIISSKFSHLYNELPKKSEQTIDGIYYHWIDTPHYRKSISIGRFWNMVVFAIRILFLNDKNLGTPDLIVVSSPSMLPIVAALKWRRKFRCKVFFEVRDIWPLTLQELGGLSKYHPLVLFMRYFEKMAYQKSDLILSLLPNAKDHYVAGGMAPHKFRYLPNGVETEKQNVQNEIVDWGINFKETDFIVGYGGSIGKANALHYLIEAAKTLQNQTQIHFVIVGKGDELANLKNQAEGLNNVHFIPPMEKSKFLMALQQFDLCYIGLEKEPLFRFGVSPNKLFDYMMAKKPILFSIDSGNRPVDEAQCGWSVSSADVTAIAHAIVDASNLSKEKLNTLGNNGFNFVVKNHSYKILCDQLLSWLDE